MKLQLYYDPWLHYLHEIRPAAERVAEKRCHEKLRQRKAYYRGKLAAAEWRYKHLLEKVKAQKPDSKPAEENTHLKHMIKSYEYELLQKQRIIDWMREERTTPRERTQLKGQEEEIQHLRRLVKEYDVQLLAAHGALRMIKEERRRDYESLLNLGFHPWNRPQ